MPGDAARGAQAPRAGKCCTGAGDVWVTDQECATIADSIGFSLARFLPTFTKSYARKAGWRLLKNKQASVGVARALAGGCEPAPTWQARRSPLGGTARFSAHRCRTRLHPPLSPPPQSHSCAQGGQDCIFLEGTRCRIYGARPLQCSSYPWWPDLMAPGAWLAESREVCEGIEHEEAPLVIAADKAGVLAAATGHFAAQATAGRRDDRGAGPDA